MRLQLASTLLLAASACATTAKPPPDRLDFSLPDMAGKIVTPAQHAGKVVIVDLWATWCAPCIAAFDFYEDLLKRHASDGLVILAVSVDEGDAEKTVSRFLEKRPVTFTVLLDPTGTLPEKLGISTMPSAAILGRDGRTLELHAGFRPGDKAKIEALVKQALAEPAPPPGEAKP